MTKAVRTTLPSGIRLVETAYQSGLVEIGVYMPDGKTISAVVSRQMVGGKWVVTTMEKTRAGLHRAKKAALAQAVAHAEAALPVDEDGFLPIKLAPRDSSWIELRFKNGSYETRRVARSSGIGDMPGIWRFENAGCLRYADEGNWTWRPIGAERAEEAAAKIDEIRSRRAA